MAAQKSKHVNPERPLGDVYRPADLRAWALYWGCAQHDVRNAAMVSGPMIVNIADFLKLDGYLRG